MYHRTPVQHTISPSMDICVSSNFERFLFALSGDDPVQLRNWMTGFEQEGRLTIDGELLAQAQAQMKSATVDEQVRGEITLLSSSIYIDNDMDRLFKKSSRLYGLDNPTALIHTRRLDSQREKK